MLTTDHLLQILSSLTSSRKLLVAFSGGLDSHVLLHALNHLQQSHHEWQLRAIHINHGLQSVSREWAEHCEFICNRLLVDCSVVHLDLSILQGQSLEAVAREARYKAISDFLQADEVLLTGHHQDDQAETLLIQLFRGAGVNGLAAMPAVSRFAKGYHIRPLLNESRKSLALYAKHHELDFIEDPSNTDQRFDRNFFRHEVVPRLKHRWPSTNRVLCRAAMHQAEAKNLLSEYLAQDLPNLKGSRADTLSIEKLMCLSSARCKAVIRYFLDQQGFLAPSEKKLQHILLDVLKAQQDAMPCVHWKGVEVRRFKDDLYAITPLSAHDPQQRFEWDFIQPLTIHSLKIRLKIEQLEDINASLLKKLQKAEVRFRQGGEMLYQAKRKRTVSLKKYFQEKNIPPWERNRIPLVFINEQLVAVATELER